MTETATFADRVQTALDAFIDEQARRLEPLGADAAALVDAARVALQGGKRLRASFCYWGFRAITAPSPEEEQALVRAAAALEILHASALVHDDFLDASDVRRGRPATHVAFADRHRRAGWAGGSGGAAQYGAAAAILLGDLLLSWADESLRRCGLPWERVVRALEIFDLCRSEVIVGQFLDVSAQARGRADVETAMTVLRYKSAKYSVERPLHIGAVLAGADDAALTSLTGFGLPLGEAFQLRDDQLGVFGDPEVTGKPAGDDLVEGKRTVLVALALDAAAPADAALLDRSLGTALSVDEVTGLREVIAGSGARDQVEQAIAELGALAARALDDAGFTPEATEALRALADAATRRTF